MKNCYCICAWRVLLEIMDTNTEPWHTKAKAYIGSEATQLLKY